MNTKENIKRMYEQAKLDTLPAKDKAVLEKMKEIYLHQNKDKTKTTEFSVWRIIMKNKMLKYSAAAVILLIILGGINLWPFNNTDKEQWWLGSSSAWGQELMMQLDSIETLIYRKQSVFVKPFGSTNVSGTWNRIYQAGDRAIKEQYYEDTDEDTFGDARPDSVLQNVTYELPDGNDLLSYNVSFEFDCFTIRELEGGAYNKDPVGILIFYVNLLDKAERILDTEVFEGKECVGFEVSASEYGDNPPEWIDRIWFDTNTMLPVRIEKHNRPVSTMPGTTFTHIEDQFEYFAQIPLELFEPVIPVDFINAEPFEIQKAREEHEKGQMIYAEVPPELADATVKAITSVENAAYRLRYGAKPDGTWNYGNRRQFFVSRYDWRENIYSNGKLQQSEWFITSQSDWAKTSFDFNDKEYSLIQATVNYNRNTYKTTTYDGSSHPDNPLDRIIFLIGWFDRADKFLENEEIDGRECYGFELSAKKYGTNPDTSKHRLWFDKQTNLPVRIEDEWLQDDGPRIMVKDQFEWNVELPQEIFVPDIPADFTLEEQIND